MYVNELSATMLEDRRKSMRTSAIVHAIIILLAILPFLKSPIPPNNFKQAILVEFDKGGSDEGSKQAAPNMESAASEEAAPEEEVVREEVPEAKPIEAPAPTPVLTSKIEPPVIQETKVRKVEIKVPEPTTTIPQKQETTTIPTPPKEVDLKPSKVKKVVIKIERPTPRKGTGKGKGKGTNKNADATKAGGAGAGGNGSADAGDSSSSGNGKGDKGNGDATTGDGGKGAGQGDDAGDGILTRMIISNPDLNDLVSESGKMSFNVCVDRHGHVTDVSFNAKHSTIKDKDIIERTLKRAKEYKFEVDPSAPTRECGRMTFIIDIQL